MNENRADRLYEQAKADILQARKPYDDALFALEQMKNSRSYILRMFLEVCRYFDPEWHQQVDIQNMLLNGTFPYVTYCPETKDLRIDGELLTQDSFILFLKAHTQKPSPPSV